MTALAAAAAMALAACGSSPSPATPAAAGPPPPAVWAKFLHLPGAVDLAGPRADGSFVVAAAGRLFILGRDGALKPFARGPGGYQTAKGPEPYLVLVSGVRVRGERCSFTAGTAFAIQPGARPGVISIDARGRGRTVSARRRVPG